MTDDKINIATFGTDTHWLQNTIENLEDRLESKIIECDQLTANLAELAEYILELETALAEAHLMSKED